MSGCYAVQKSADYYGVRTAGQNVVFLLDTSGSMEGKDEGTLENEVEQEAANQAANVAEDAIGGSIGEAVGGQVRGEATKLGAAKRELIPAVRGLEETSLYAIATFGSNVNTWHSSLVAATSVQRTADAARINGLDASGSTPMLAAIERGFQYSGATTFFLLTDGQPTDSNAGQILERVRELNENSGIIIHTIGFGEDKDEDFLRQLAEENGGQYVDRTQTGRILPF